YLLSYRSRIKPTVYRSTDKSTSSRLPSAPTIFTNPELADGSFWYITKGFSYPVMSGNLWSFAVAVATNPTKPTQAVTDFNTVLFILHNTYSMEMWLRLIVPASPGQTLRCHSTGSHLWKS